MTHTATLPSGELSGWRRADGRSAQVSPGMVSAARRQESEEEDVGDEDDEEDDRSGWGWGYTQAL